MKKEDFMPYTSTSKLPYSWKILGMLGEGENIPDTAYEKGDVWLISPPNSVYGGLFAVFFDGSQFRLPRYPHADTGCGRDGKIRYIFENEFFDMFTL